MQQHPQPARRCALISSVGFTCLKFVSFSTGTMFLFARQRHRVYATLPCDARRFWRSAEQHSHEPATLISRSHSLFPPFTPLDISALENRRMISTVIMKTIPATMEGKNSTPNDTVHQNPRSYATSIAKAPTNITTPAAKKKSAQKVTGRIRVRNSWVLGSMLVE